MTTTTTPDRVAPRHPASAPLTDPAFLARLATAFDRGAAR
jgi:hypothetical protein